MSSENQSFVVTDGNAAVATIGYSMSDMCFIYPITPASTMGEKADDLSAAGKKNIFGDVVRITQMQSEGGVSGALHGAILSGALCSTFTCSQGLLLMIPEMYKIAGELQPAVFHVASRSVGGQAMVIYCDHGDVMATRQTGWSILCSHSVQQAADMAAIAHAATVRAQIPILHFFDGFRVSHELQKILLPGNEILSEMMDRDSIRKWRETKTMKNSDPTMRGLVDNTDEYFPLLEGTNGLYTNLIKIMQEMMDKYAKLTGRQYHLFDYYGAPDAEYVIVAMGTSCKTFEEYVNQPEIKEKKKYGLIAVHLFHPFSVEHFVECIPKTCKHITILDRTKEPGAAGEPLYLECLAALQESGKLGQLKVSGGRYGLGGRDITPSIAWAVYNNMESASPKYKYTVGFEDDVTHLSIPMPKEKVVVTLPGVKQALFYGFGADGTVGAIKDAIKIIGDHTPLYSQAYFVYDAKKSGGVTISHIRFGPDPISSQYEILDADYLACHHPSYIRKYDMLQHAKEGGVFVLNGPWKSTAEVGEALPGQAKQLIVKKKLQMYTIDAEKIAREAGLAGRINIVMQTVFFYLSQVVTPMEKAIEYQKGAIKKTYEKKGMEIVEKNWKCVDSTIANLVKIDYPVDEWSKSEFEEIPVFPAKRTEFFKKIAGPILALRGAELKVSDVMPLLGGSLPTGTAQFEKRNVSATVPIWDETKCVQCNICSYSCPHSCIRPFLITEKEASVSPSMKTLKPSNPAPQTLPGTEENLRFAISISTADCLGCGVCASVCPAQCLAMKPNHTEETDQMQKDFEYLVDLPERSNLLYDDETVEEKAKTDKLSIVPAPTVKAVQFKRPLFEFSAACAGCAESPVVRVITQLYGERMMISNACGCSMVWGGYSPSCAYSHSKEGLGPVYTGSLFEDAAELGYGIATAGQMMREQLLEFVKKAQACHIPESTGVSDAEMKKAMDGWINSYDSPVKSKKFGQEIHSLLARIPAEERAKCDILTEIWTRRDYFQKKSYWTFGGDGWAYDIDFGGLDQVLHMGADLNILVMDTEVYSNTGGQKSKSTPRSAVARFAAAGKDTSKKNLGLYAINLGCCYVAQVAQGANPQQMLKAIHEAEQFPGTSIVIALCPCINWGLKNGQGNSMKEQKLAVECGYWPLYRYNPLLAKEGKNPFSLDSAPPKKPVTELLKQETRFASLLQQSKERGEALQSGLQADIDATFAKLQALAAQPAK
ncbi:pyruvate-ferrodoxin oxidoreductase (PFO) [Monocercomonoides exilis]|uniref:pyruvate-ferrodoxin oxidoreductase (PFO) n=1 Tax=Monocercomonoides exilis TaxID=2049356 RepID=UPI0035595BDD|nr:pyruvate-ferrodoxin oxidoreductase (PFO) [Monocercomonoides exilis]|eukprot:MONOS_9530.1-p1 / transcript=MONOS_9530.1 / gene=MONOS_9530 / organism=Monocercomonoides_exilis_PA203 / gene_product=pyruvate-ferrodoxin oxidoreductase (PFO) / transcript_product=pyruvate-ferrodoxin oxidoreductase (PFO) / location=Mono_scaffold00397:2143-5885(+) / protein_length=1222 / sequence_SO=supercontig / SO=protein_coding / is_pseudo=false